MPPPSPETDLPARIIGVWQSWPDPFQGVGEAPSVSI